MSMFFLGSNPTPYQRSRALALSLMWGSGLNQWVLKKTNSNVGRKAASSRGLSSRTSKVGVSVTPPLRLKLSKYAMLYERLSRLKLSSSKHLSLRIPIVPPIKPRSIARRGDGISPAARQEVLHDEGLKTHTTEILQWYSGTLRERKVVARTQLVSGAEEKVRRHLVKN
ncbi:hypothetical protein C8J57DRAFT_1226293 [Mycena rebaudengoi]|nr:hypothetical protein C8J57DRAFT_1226293 [Mycena rebaudengoi]